MRAPGYDCLDFAREVWLAEKGEDLGREPLRLRAFERLDRPESPCLVLMRAPKREPHIGVYLRGRVLHLRARAEWQPLEIASFGYHAEFWR